MPDDAILACFICAMDKRHVKSHIAFELIITRCLYGLIWCHEEGVTDFQWLIFSNKSVNNKQLGSVLLLVSITGVAMEEWKIKHAKISVVALWSIDKALVVRKLLILPSLCPLSFMSHYVTLRQMDCAKNEADIIYSEPGRCLAFCCSSTKAGNDLHR